MLDSVRSKDDIITLRFKKISNRLVTFIPSPKFGYLLQDKRCRCTASPQHQSQLSLLSMLECCATFSTNQKLVLSAGYIKKTKRKKTKNIMAEKESDMATAPPKLTIAGDSRQSVQQHQQDSTHISVAHQQRRKSSTSMANKIKTAAIKTTITTMGTKTATPTTTKSLHTLLGIDQPNAQLEFSQIELIYRAEGNANLVLALPQFGKVLRLPKTAPNVSNSKNQQQQQQPADEQRPESKQQLHQILTMYDFVAYIEIMRTLLGNGFIFKADIVEISQEADRKYINARIRNKRPAHRLDKEFCEQFGLLLPDATQLPATCDILLSNFQPKAATFVGDTFAIEIKPKQGWLLPSDVHDLFEMRTPMTSTTAPTPAKVAKPDSRCRYCAMQFLKLKNRKIATLSSYCPIELYSGNPSRMSAALAALFECPQNNLRVFRNGILIYGDHLNSVSLKYLMKNICADIEPIFINTIFIELIFIKLIFIEPICNEPIFIEPIFIVSIFIEPIFMEPIFIVSIFIKPIFNEPIFIEPIFKEPVFIEPIIIEPKSSTNQSSTNQLSTNQSSSNQSSSNQSSMYQSSSIQSSKNQFSLY